jgi:hypothetical protein
MEQLNTLSPGVMPLGLRNSTSDGSDIIVIVDKEPAIFLRAACGMIRAWLVSHITL